MKPKPHLACGGIFTPNPDLPADHLGRQVCRCGLPGKPGDAHHTLPETPPDDAMSRAAGERKDGS